MEAVVQKFGGTSLGTGERLAAVTKIIANEHAYSEVIVVVSAVSPLAKKDGTTSRLLLALDRAVTGGDFEEQLQVVRSFHERIANDAPLNPTSRERFLRHLDRVLGETGNLLRALTVIREVSPRSQDAVIGVGERLSAELLASCLTSVGVPARSVDFSRCADDLPPTQCGFATLATTLGSLAMPKDREVVVATGFVGTVAGGLLNAVGRGYSDHTAALIAANLAEKTVVRELQVWKEVDGVFTADPRLVPTARCLPQITTHEAAEITFFGAEVLHPMTMERVAAVSIPVRVKNVVNPSGQGTLITNRVSSSGGLPVTAITGKKGVVVCTLRSNRMFAASGFLARIFDVLAEHQIVADLVATSEVAVSFTVSQTERIERAKPALEQLGTVDLFTDMAILAIVGEGVRGSTSIPANLFAALEAVGIAHTMITAASVGTNISLVLASRDLEAAVAAAHRAFFEGDGALLPDA